MPRMPDYMRGLIGYAQQQLGMGRSADETLEKLRTNPRFAGIADRQFRQAVANAEENNIALERANLTKRIAICGAFGEECPRDVLVGARVVMTVTLQNGMRVQISVIVNVRGTTNLQDALNAAVALVESGAYVGAGNYNYKGRISKRSVRAVQLFRGGFSNAQIIV